MTWQNAVAVIYVSAVALYVLYGFTIKDTHLEEVITKTGLMKLETTNALLVSLKFLYLFSMPALVLLGIHLAREIAISGGASTNVTDALMTSWRVFMGIYMFTLLVTMIIVVKATFSVFFTSTVGTIKNFRTRRPTRDKAQS